MKKADIEESGIQDLGRLQILEMRDGQEAPRESRSYSRVQRVTHDSQDSNLYKTQLHGDHRKKDYCNF